MNNNEEGKTVESFLTKLGFDEAAARIYTALASKGPQAILELSRNSSVERTKLYRLLDALIEKGIAEEVLADKRRMFKATEPAKIKLLIERKKLKIKELEDSFSLFEGDFAKMAAKVNQARMVYFNGRDGIRQILWNELGAKTELVGYLYRILQEPLGLKFFERWAQEHERRKLRFRDLRSDEFVKSMQLPQYPRRKIEGSTWRYIPDEILHLTHNMDIYNDVVAIYYWQNEELFGLEIHNQQIADMQRSMFEVFWEMAGKYKKEHEELLKAWEK